MCPLAPPCVCFLNCRYLLKTGVGQQRSLKRRIDTRVQNDHFSFKLTLNKSSFDSYNANIAESVI